MVGCDLAVEVTDAKSQVASRQSSQLKLAVKQLNNNQ